MITILNYVCVMAGRKDEGKVKVQLASVNLAACTRRAISADEQHERPDDRNDSAICAAYMDAVGHGANFLSLAEVS